MLVGELAPLLRPLLACRFDHPLAGVIVIEFESPVWLALAQRLATALAAWLGTCITTGLTPSTTCSVRFRLGPLHVAITPAPQARRRAPATAKWDALVLDW
ncbi:MAG: hypothetical protein R6X13_01580 [bacterium]